MVLRRRKKPFHEFPPGRQPWSAYRDDQNVWGSFVTFFCVTGNFTTDFTVVPLATTVDLPIKRLSWEATTLLSDAHLLRKATQVPRRNFELGPPVLRCIFSTKSGCKS